MDAANFPKVRPPGSTPGEVTRWRGWANGKVARLKPESFPGSSPGPRTNMDR